MKVEVPAESVQAELEETDQAGRFWPDFALLAAGLACSFYLIASALQISRELIPQAHANALDALIWVVPSMAISAVVCWSLFRRPKTHSQAVLLWSALALLASVFVIGAGLAFSWGAH